MAEIKNYKGFSYVCKDLQGEEKLKEYIDSLGESPKSIPDASEDNYNEWHCDYDFAGVKYLKLPEDIIRIGKCAFAQSKLQVLEAPGVKIIDELAFYNTKELDSVSAPKCECLLTSIIDDSGKIGFAEGSDAFNHSHVKVLNLPSVRAVGRYAFYDMPNITEINLPSLESMKPHAVYGCEELLKIDLGNLADADFAIVTMNPNLAQIKASRLNTKHRLSFIGNSSVCNEISAKISKNNEKSNKLDENALKNAERDRSFVYDFEYRKQFFYTFLSEIPEEEIDGLIIEMNKLIDSWIRKGEVLSSFNKDNNESSVDILKKVKYLHLGPSIKRIGDYAFAKCDCLASVEAPSVEKVGDHAFYCAFELGNVYMPRCTELANDAFNGAASNYDDKRVARIYIPNVQKIGRHAFWQTGFSVINMPKCDEFGPTAIEENLFLQKVVAKNIDTKYAITNNPNLKEVVCQSFGKFEKEDVVVCSSVENNENF